MAEMLVKAVDAVHPDLDTDRKGSYKRGYPVIVFEDGHPWGNEERLPRFVVIKIPGIPVGRVQKYIEEWTEPTGSSDPMLPNVRRVQRRRWTIRWNGLPQRAKNRLQNDGELIISAGGYEGTSDYSWAQVKQFFRNTETGLDESEDL